MEATRYEFAPFFAKVKPFFTQIKEMKHDKVLDQGAGSLTEEAVRAP